MCPVRGLLQPGGAITKLQICQSYFSEIIANKIHDPCAFWDRQLIKRSWVNSGVSDFRVNREILTRLASQISSPFLGILLAIFSVQFQKQIVSLMNGVFISSGKSLILTMCRWFVSMGGELAPTLYYFSFS